MPEFRCHGFGYPPVGLMDVIKQSSTAPDSIFYLIDAIGAGLPPEQELKEIDKGRLWVVINTHEPASYRWFDRLLAHLTDKCGIDPQRIILHSSCVDDPASPILSVASPVDYATDIIRQLGKALFPGEITHHYICLNRQHRWQRKLLIDLLKSKKLDRFGHISYLDAPDPIILDMPDVNWQDQRKTDHPFIKNAAFNIITETAYEPKKSQDIIENHYRPSLTEKTFKPIYLCQFPIWVSAQGTVDYYRDLGFDAFDDIIDHSYDGEPDPMDRIDFIIKEIDRLVQISLEEWRKTRILCQDRFQKNLDRLIYFGQGHLWELPKWNQIFR